MDRKKLTSFLFGGLLAATTMAQAPQGISYQAVLRNGSGAIEANTSVTLGLAILQGSATGTVVYNENHAVTSNGFGLVNVTLGGGTVVSGTFSNINWSTGAYWVRTTFGGTELGTSKLQSVPYALYAPSSASLNGTTNMLVKFTGPSTGANSNIFDNGTKVGIGTTTPTGLLDVKGGGFPNKPQMRLIEETGSYSRLQFRNSNTGLWTAAALTNNTSASSLFNIHFTQAADGTGGNDILRVSGQGKVGINGFDPTTGSLYDGMLGVKQSGSTNALSLSAAGSEGMWGFYVGAQFYMYQNNTSIGNFNKTTGAYSSTSDVRLKENIKPAGHVLDLVKDVQVMRYTYKRDPGHTPQLGYIAQELEKQFPEFVNKPEEIEGKETAYTVNYAGMSAVAIKAIQEQQELIESMAKAIDELKARIGQLEAR